MTPFISREPLGRRSRTAAIWAAARSAGPQVVWIRLGNATHRTLAAWLEPRWSEIEQRLSDGVHLVEVGRFAR